MTSNGDTNIPGFVTIGAGVTSFLDNASVDTTVVASGQTNIAVGLGTTRSALPVVFYAPDGSGGAVMTAESTSGYNEFYGGTGSDTITSFGQGAQTYYVGATGSQQITGSTVSGAANEYIFDQDSTGAGANILTNFRLGTDHIDINLNGSLSGITIESIQALTGSHSGTLVMLSDNTTMQLYGVAKSSLSPSLIGGTHI